MQSVDDEDTYMHQNGKIISEDAVVELIPGSTIHVFPRMFGGKGGFGSMLRAIGAQIEKTTNREACRDLSGRRMRDVNDEKKLVLFQKMGITRKLKHFENQAYHSLTFRTRAL